MTNNMYANMQMKTLTHLGKHSPTHTHHTHHTNTKTHSEDWRIATLAGTAMRDGWLYLQCYMPPRAKRVREQSLILQLYTTVIQEGWMSHRKVNNTPARSLKTENKYRRTGNLWARGGKKRWMTVSALLTVTIWSNYSLYLRARVYFCVLFNDQHTGNVNKKRINTCITDCVCLLLQCLWITLTFQLNSICNDFQEDHDHLNPPLLLCLSGAL